MDGTLDGCSVVFFAKVVGLAEFREKEEEEEGSS